jgi:hypothetical protein
MFELNKTRHCEEQRDEAIHTMSIVHAKGAMDTPWSQIFFVQFLFMPTWR